GVFIAPPGLKFEFAVYRMTPLIQWFQSLLTCPVLHPWEDLSHPIGDFHAIRQGTQSEGARENCERRGATFSLRRTDRCERRHRHARHRLDSWGILQTFPQQE